MPAFAWLLWRLVTDARLSSTLVEIETQWSMDDMFEAHLTLDAMDEAEARGRKKAEDEARRARA